MTSHRSTGRLPALLQQMALRRPSSWPPTSRHASFRRPSDGEDPAGEAAVVHDCTGMVRTTLDAATGSRREVSYRVHSWSSRTGDDPARPVFVLVHGIGMSHRYFARLRAELVPYGDTLVLDLPGFGGTPRPASQLCVGDYAAVIATALVDAGRQSCVVVGHSIGAQFVTELAVNRPDLVSAVVLIGPVTDTSHPTAARNAAALALDTLLERPVTNLLVGAAYLRCGIRWYLKELPVMLDYRLDERLAVVAQPVLVLRGALDPVAGRTWCRRLAAAAPDGRIAEVPGQPHAAHRTGSRFVAGAILRFVEDSRVRPSADRVG
ncbi:alpha/beta hydrolase [Arthrobacter sp. NamB2]|uniref:alpha/beta fold hydrolase n=1 Tax=Arthrobacter sp. NamB2 TaxID=2576035 RepID=UPI0010C97D82|nr:alpha/beta hydrolase [Arthrobacter sp. NamB2]TKV29136.1 alpha/beta hydrolase [Arthrobacter sp. NamB2]